MSGSGAVTLPGITPTPLHEGCEKIVFVMERPWLLFSLKSVLQVLMEWKALFRPMVVTVFSRFTTLRYLYSSVTFSFKNGY